MGNPAPVRRALLPLAAIAVLGCGLQLYATHWDIGVNNDSVLFIDAARNLAAGRGFVVSTDGAPKRLTHHPPLYPGVLALGTHAAHSTLAMARWFHALVFGAIIFSVGAMLLLEGAGTPLALVAALFVCLDPFLLQLHAYAWTEPFFILLVIWGLGLLAAHIRDPSPLVLVGATALLALAVLTRYAGFAFVGAGALVLLLLERGSLSRRLGSALFVLAGGSLPMLAWLGWNAALTGSPANRALLFHPMGVRHVVQLGWTTFGWTLPLDMRLRHWLPVVALSAGALLWGVAGRVDLRRRDAPVSVLVVCSCAYLTFLALASTFVDAGIEFDERRLAPVFPLAVLAVCLLVVRALEGRRVSPPVAVLAVLWLLPLATHGAASLRWAADAHADGIGYTAREWRESAVLQSIASLPPSTAVYSNRNGAVHFLTDRPVGMIPRKRVMTTDREIPDYAASMSHVCEATRRGALVVLFSEFRDWYPTEEEVRATLGLKAVSRDSLATLYEADAAVGCPEPGGDAHSGPRTSHWMLAAR